jgi:hypothetical protein
MRIFEIVWIVAVLACLAGRVDASCRAFNNSTSPARVVDEQFAAFNAHDLNAFSSCYADDVSMIDLSGRRPPIEGIAALRRTFAYLPTSKLGVGVRIVRRIATGNLIVDQEHPTGLAADKVLPDLIAVYEVQGGRIRRVWFPPPD